MKFTEEFIERVAHANNLVDVISQYTQLKPAGGGLMGRCPFPDHPEKTPSFSVSEHKQVYHCFGCHKKGNIYTFLQEYNGMSFRESVEYLAGRANIALPELNREESSAADAQSKKKKQLAVVNKWAAQYFHETFLALPSDHPAKAYAHKRGLNQDLINEFKIGYASEEWDGLVKYFESKNVPLSLAEEARLVKARTGGKSGYFDIFRDRLMFPIFSTMGEPIAFGGRIIAQGEPKYLNSPETLVFHKGRVLYGLSQTAKFIRTEDQAIVVEGYMDLVSLYKAGICNVVAPMGTALTFDQGKLLQRMTQNVVVLFDGDSAGQDAAERSLPLLLAANVHPRGLILEDNMDPDDFVTKFGREALLEKIKAAPDLFSLMLGVWLKDYRGEASQKVQITDKLAPLFAAISDSRLRQLYFTEVAGRLRVDEKWLRQALVPGKKDTGYQNNFRQNSSQNPSQNAVSQRAGGVTSGAAHGRFDHTANAGPDLQKPLTEDVVDKIKLKGTSQAEAYLMGLVLKNHANFAAFDSANIMEEIPHPGVKEVLKRASEVYRQAPEKFDKLTSLLTSFVDQPSLLFASVSMDIAPEDEAKLLQDCIIRIREQYIQEKTKQLAIEMKNSPSPEKLELMMKLQKDRLALKSKPQI